MSSFPVRPACAALVLLAFSGPAYSQSGDAGQAAAVTAATPAPAPVERQDTAEAKLAVALRSYSLVSNENDQLRAAQEKLAAEKAALAIDLSAAKSNADALRNDLATASAGAAQTEALREQLRQTQDQVAALSLENNQLKTKLALSQPAQGSAMASPTHPGAAPAPEATVTAAPETPAATPAVRTHVIVAGDTLSKISRQYYGTPDRWTDILAANREMLHDEKSLIVGRTLRIP